MLIHIVWLWLFELVVLASGNLESSPELASFLIFAKSIHGKKWLSTQKPGFSGQARNMSQSHCTRGLASMLWKDPQKMLVSICFKDTNGAHLTVIWSRQIKPHPILWPPVNPIRCKSIYLMEFVWQAHNRECQHSLNIKCINGPSQRRYSLLTNVKQQAVARKFVPTVGEKIQVFSWAAPHE